MAGIGMKNDRPPRFWAHAIEKRDAEGGCRNPYCPGHGYTVEFAHLSGREYDPIVDCPICHTAGTIDDVDSGADIPCPACKGCGQVQYVRPESGMPLCGPVTDTGTCHNLQESGELDVLPFLRPEEGLCVVGDLGVAPTYRKLSGEGRGPSLIEARRLLEQVHASDDGWVNDGLPWELRVDIAAALGESI